MKLLAIALLAAVVLIACWFRAINGYRRRRIAEMERRHEEIKVFEMADDVDHIPPGCPVVLDLNGEVRPAGLLSYWGKP